MLIVDAVTRLLPGSLGNEASSQNESFSVGRKLRRFLSSRLACPT